MMTFVLGGSLLISRVETRILNRERKYNFLYATIEGMIDSMPDDKKSYDQIKAKLTELERMRMNTEKTDVLKRNFYNRFGKIYCETLLATI
jgi:hypothetical protein